MKVIWRKGIQNNCFSFAYRHSTNVWPEKRMQQTEKNERKMRNMVLCSLVAYIEGYKDQFKIYGIIIQFTAWQLFLVQRLCIIFTYPNKINRKWKTNTLFEWRKNEEIKKTVDSCKQMAFTSHAEIQIVANIATQKAFQIMPQVGITTVKFYFSSFLLLFLVPSYLYTLFHNYWI